MVKLVSVTVQKNESGKIGLSFVDTSDGNVVIKRISDTSPFADTAIEPEMTIKTVNTVPVDGFNAMKIKSMLTSLPDEISLICSKPTSRKSSALTATNIQAVTARKNAAGKTGIQIHDAEGGGGVVLVKYIAEDSPFANTPVQPDMAVLGINDIYCDGMDAKQVRSIFSVMQGDITLFVGTVPDAAAPKAAAAKKGALPTFCTATASKDAGKIGLAFTDQADGTVKITNIKDTSPFAETSLKKGMVICTLNSVSCAGLNANQIKSVVKALPEEITMTAALYPGTVKSLLQPTNVQTATVDAAQKTKLGLDLEWQSSNGTVLIKSIDEDSPLQGSDITKGMTLLSINNLTCDGMNVQQVQAYIASLSGDVTLIAGSLSKSAPSKPSSAPVQLASATVQKNEKGKIGLSFVDKSDGSVVITKISDTSPFANTSIQTDMTILTLNTVPVDGMDAGQIKTMLASLPDTITLVCAGGKSKVKASNFQVVSANRDDSGKVGIGMVSKFSDGSVIITNVKEDSPFSGTPIAKGQAIYTVNNISTHGMDAVQVRSLFRSVEEPVTLFVADPSRSGMSSSRLLPGAKIVHATVNKTDKGKIGMSFADRSDGCVEITKISETSPFADTDITVGMTILTINTVPVSGMNATRIKSTLASLPETITMVAANMPDKGLAAKNVQVVELDEAPKDGEIGVEFEQRGSAGLIAIKSIADDSPFKSTELTKGQTILSVNGLSCDGLDISQLKALFSSIAGPVTLYAGQLTSASSGGAPAAAPMDLVSATVEKTPAGKIGLSFVDKSDGTVMITNIKDTSPFADTDIKPDMIIKTVNTVPVEGMNANKIKSMLQSLPAEITMIAAKGGDSTAAKTKNVQVATVNKKENNKVGLSMIDKKGGVVVITKVSDDSPFAGTAIAKGMKILAINNVSCYGMDANQIRAVFKSVPDPITLFVGATAERTPSMVAGAAPMKLVTATVEKTPEGKIGLGFTDQSDGSVMITKISETSPFADTAIKPDMVIKTINSVPVDGMNANKIKSMLQSLPKEISMIAAKGGDSAAAKAKNVQVATVSKTAEGKVGLSFVDKRSGAVVITKVSDTSPFAGTAIKPGMKLLAINDVSCYGMDSNQIRAVFSSVPDPLTLFAGATAERTPSILAAPKRPLFVSADVEKNESGKIGLVFLDQKDGSVQISTIKETSPFAGTAIKTGMTIVSINGISCAGMDANRIKETLSSLPTSISMVAADLKGGKFTSGGGVGATGVQSVTVSEKDLAAGNGLGVTFVDGMDNTVTVSEIAEDSPLAASGLITKGMTILSVNNVSSEGMDVQQVESLASSTAGGVTLIAGTVGAKPSLSTRSISSKLAMQLVIASASKNESGKVGLSFVDKSNGSVVVTKISETSPFAGSPLKKDMVVKTINKIPVDGMNANKIKAMLGTLPDDITIIAARVSSASVAAKSAKNVQYASASRNESGKIGLSFVDKKDGSVMITKISDESPFASSDITQGMTFLSVNGVSAEGMDAKQIRGMFKTVPDPIEIFASSASGATEGAMTLPLFVSASVEKSESGKVGLVFLDQPDGSVVVTNIKDTSPFAGTAIKKGMALVTVNGVPVSGMDAGRIKTMLSSLPKEITLVAADLSKATGAKAKNAQVATVAEGEELGVTFEQLPNGTITISDIAEDSPLASGDVKKGMTVFSINNMSCSGMSVKQLESLVASVSGSTAVVAGTLSSKPTGGPPKKLGAKFVSVTAEKNDKGKIGLSFVDKSDGSVVITKISDTSPFAGTAIAKDMVIKTINTVPLDGMDSNQIKAIVGSLPKEITVVAAKISGTSPATKAKDVQVATANKTPEGKVGLAFIDAQDGSVVLTNVSDESPFAGMGLAKGMSILAVNDIPCEGLSATQIRSIIKSCPEPISIFAGVTPGNAPKPTRAPPAPGSVGSSAKMEFVAATVEKSPDGKIGLAFVDQPNGTVMITGVKDTSPFASTDIAKGMTILTINSIACDGMSATRIKSVLSALPGSITMIAGTATGAVSNVQVISVEEVPKDGTGISFVERDAGYVTVADIADDSPFKSTDLKKGMSIFSVNDMGTDAMDAKQLGALLESLPSSITMFAGKMSRGAAALTGTPSMTFATATVEKSPNGKVGLSFVDRSDGTVVITKISDTSPFADTEITKGMVIKTVNTIPCDGMEASRIRALFSSLPTSITLVAAMPSAAAEAQSRAIVPANSKAIVPAGTSAMTKARSVQVVTTNKNVNGKVGLKLIDQSDGSVGITGITEDSPFASSAITPGMSVLSINNIPCEGMKASQIRSIFTSCPDPITLFAGKLTSAPAAKKIMLTCVSATAEKNDQGKVGISFSDTAEGPVTITKIGEASPFVGSPLKKGMTILTVNGISCDGMYANQINSLFASFDGPITIVAAQPVGPSNAVPFQDVQVVTVDDVGEKAGLTFAEGKEGTVIVDEVDEDSPFADTDVVNGVTVLSINNMPCDSMDTSQVQGLLASSTGSTSLIVGKMEGAEGDPSMPEGAVIGTKQTMQFAAATVARGEGGTGLTLMDLSDGSVIITDVAEDSPFYATAITEDMSIFTVNNISCDGLSARQVHAVFAQVPGTHYTVFAGTLTGVKTVVARNYTTPLYARLEI